MKFDQKIDLELLLSLNSKCINEFENNQIVCLAKSEMIHQDGVSTKLLDCIQIFSDYFQKTVMLRRVFTDKFPFRQVAHSHLVEEFGHDVSLMNDRGNKISTWDPIIESGACWFAWKMFSLDAFEKTFLVHLVLEASANLFFSLVHKAMKDQNKTAYFALHSEQDEKHEKMGIDLLRNLRECDYRELMKLQKEGWDVLNMVCNRIAEIAVQSNESSSQAMAG